MTQVMTVTGPMEAAQMGFTLTHEHLFLSLILEYRADGLLNDPRLAVEEVRAFKAAGGKTLWDVTTVGLGRDALAVREVAQATGLNIVLGAGNYRDPYIDRDWIDRAGVDAMAEIIVRDLEQGVDDTGVRCGIIGEIGADKAYVSAAEERSFRAAARAHLRTGVTITTHAARWPVGRDQLAILRHEGVDPRRVIIGHSDTVPVPEYHEEMARQGCFVQFDTIRGNTEYDTARRVEYVLNMAGKGLLGQVLLSHDVCLLSHMHFTGGGGYDFIPTRFLPRLRDAGLSQEQIQQLTVENPRRAITGE